MKRFSLGISGLLLLAGWGWTQVPDAPVAPPASSVPAPTRPPPGGSPLGEEIPVFDPATEIVTWGGKSWNISNQRIFQARFEKYLSAPEQTSVEQLEYQKLIHEILAVLAPNHRESGKLARAFVLLFRAGVYDADGGICNALGSAVATAWQAQRNQNQLALSMGEMKREIQLHESKSTMFAEAQYRSISGTSTNTAAGVQPMEMRMMLAQKEAVALQAQIGVLTARREVSALQARVQFQALMVQMFLQRRFQHVVIACQLYSQLFTEGDVALKVEGQTKELFTKDIGMPPTVNTLQSLATEAMRDVREGVQAYLYLSANQEMDSATKRLSEAFATGEYLPDVRGLPRDQKRLALSYMQRANRLVSALEVRDYVEAETLLQELRAQATDFDATKPRAAIETAKSVSNMHLLKARNAAIAGDRANFEAELKQAATIWPLNPALGELATTIFASADVQSQALVEFDRLLSQGNHRQIFNDKLRFIAATATSPAHQAKLKQVLDDMQVIETVLAKAEELAKRDDPAGAWETVERAAREFADDVVLNQRRAELSSAAAGFVQSLRRAQQLETQAQTGASLAWYLKAQREYPLSELAREGIDRLMAVILPAS